MYKIDARTRACGALNNLKKYGINGTSKMRWENEGANDCRLPDWIYAQYKIFEAFGSGFISWNIFNLALDKTEAAGNGSWMFENNI